MNECCYLLGKSLLQSPSAWVLTVLFNEHIDGFLVKAREYLYISLCIIVSDIEPELIESVWCGAVAVEPYITTLCFSEFLSVSLGDERACESESLCVVA